MGAYDSRGYLFSDFDLTGVFETSRQNLRSEVEGLEQNKLLNMAEEDLIGYLAGRYALEAPALHQDQMTADQHEVKVDVRYDRNRWIDDTSRPALVPGQRIEIEVPFSGQADLLRARPSTYTLSPPIARIANKALIFSFEVPNDVEKDIRPELDRQLAEIERYLERTREEVSRFNATLRGVAETAVRGRKERLLANQGRVAALGIPLKVRGDSPKTYAPPEIRQKVVPTLPAASSQPFTPEPVMTEKHYEHVLTVVQNMTQVMERSPSEFANMGEEALRQHYLVQLNGHFEGQATGETFNASGKTDILLRIDGKNVFIAECKFWKGQKVYGETIDQLLGYSSWRDTKTAILIFNRNRDTSKVLEEIKAATEAHPNYKRTVQWRHESGYRFVMHHPSDKNRELIMTVLVFDIPEAEAKPAPAKKAAKKVMNKPSE